MKNVKTLAARIAASAKNGWDNYTDPDKMANEKSFPMFRKK
jgi:hypothetical protein